MKKNKGSEKVTHPEKISDYQIRYLEFFIDLCNLILERYVASNTHVPVSLEDLKRKDSFYLQKGLEKLSSYRVIDFNQKVSNNSSSSDWKCEHYEIYIYEAEKIERIRDSVYERSEFPDEDDEVFTGPVITGFLTKEQLAIKEYIENNYLYLSLDSTETYVLINNIVCIKELNYDNPNEFVLRHLIRNPNRKFSYDQLKKDLEPEIKREIEQELGKSRGSVAKFIENLGITKDLRKVFFDTINRDRVCLTTPVSKEEVDKRLNKYYSGNRKDELVTGEFVKVLLRTDRNK